MFAQWGENEEMLLHFTEADRVDGGIGLVERWCTPPECPAPVAAALLEYASAKHVEREEALEARRWTSEATHYERLGIMRPR